MFLAHTLIIAMTGVNGDLKYASYREGKIFKTSEDLFNGSGVNLHNARGYEQIRQFQNYLLYNKVIVFNGLSPDLFLFSGNSLSNKKSNHL